MGFLIMAMSVFFKLTGIRVFVKSLSNRLWDTNPHLALLSEEQSNESNRNLEGAGHLEMDSVS